jgi:hypothetical protein
VVSLIGNHEEFPLVYGISPRLPVVGRADEMICADHNLTYAEGILMFGPTYGKTPYGEGWNIGNMDESRRFFFHLYFNPLSDFILTCRKQVFLCLDWDQGQDLFDIKPWGSHLTRSVGGVSDLQLELIRTCKQLGTGKRSGHSLVLLSHFAFLGFSEQIPLFKEGWEAELKPIELTAADKMKALAIGVATLDPIRGIVDAATLEERNRPSHDYAHGTFNHNIKETYQELFSHKPGEKTFDYILSGHTHRPAAYFITSPADGSGRIKYKASRLFTSPLNLSSDKKPCILVSGSSGPIGKQNLEGEFGKWGHTCPAGNIVRYQDKGLSQYGIMEFQTDGKDKSFRPRFAVALDYFNIMEEKGVFTRFESQQVDPYIFHIEINPLIFPGQSNFTVEIAELKLYYYSTNGSFAAMEPKSITVLKPLYFGCVFDKDSFKDHLRAMAIAEVPFTFLSLKFNPINKAGFDQYDYSSPWLYRVQVVDYQKEAEQLPLKYPPSQLSYRPDYGTSNKGVEIKTHKDAEVPDFKLYSGLFPKDYLVLK